MLVPSRRHVVVGALAAALAGCGEGGAPSEPSKTDAEGVKKRVDLVDAEEWRFVTGEEDPFAGERPMDRQCDLTAIAVEGDVSPVLEISTEICNYATVGQPSVAAVSEGDVVEVVVSHNNLRADQSAEAFAAVRLGEDVLWSERVPIPGDSQSYRGEWTASRDYPKGTPVLAHIDNHGTNTWRVLSITGGPPEP